VLETDAGPLATTVAAAATPWATTIGDPPDHLLVDFAPNLSAATARLALRGNVAMASQGETQPDEPLGNADAAVPFAQFRLSRSPLTYIASPADIAGKAELQIRVNDELWQEAPSLYARGPTERIYTARQSDTGDTYVTFGDGNNGARLPSGAMNVVAHYRTGSGLAGDMQAGQLSILLERPVGLRAVANPLAADGGADAEPRDKARGNAPTTVRTFGRAVSLDDFEWLATSSGLVARAYVTWVWHALQRAVHLTVAGPNGAVLSPASMGLLYDALTAARDPNRQLFLANLVRVPLVVGARLLRDPAFTADLAFANATAALGEAFSFEAMALGAAVHASHVMAVMQSARGVAAVGLDLFQLKGFAALSPKEREVRAVTAGPVQDHIRIFPARPTPSDTSLIDRYARAGFTGSPPPVLAAEQAFIETPATDLDLVVVEAL
jgi:predicted phage baseplate assembly protein